MTRSRRPSDRRPDLPSDPGSAAVARKLAQALGAAADEIEPRADAYARLAIRVQASVDCPTRHRPWWSPSPRLALGVAVGALAVVTLAAVTIPAVGRDQNLQSAAIGGGASRLNPGMPTTGPAGSTGGASTTRDPAAMGDLESSEVVGPPGPTPEAAAYEFLFLIGLTSDGSFDLERSGDTVEVVTSPEGDGPGRTVSVLQVVELTSEADGGARWAVAAATSPDVVIDRLLIDGRPIPPVGTAAAGTDLTVEGAGVGPLGTIEMDLVSATLGDRLGVADTVAGRVGEPVPFAATVPLVGTEDAWVVVTATSGSEGVPGAFAARPVSYVGSPDARAYAVTRIDQSDPDMGLRLRTGPGREFEVVTIVPRGGLVTRSPEDFPVAGTTSGAWWPVVTETGQTGWMASDYLAGSGSVLGPDEAIAAARQFLAAAGDPAQAAAQLPVWNHPLRLWIDGEQFDLEPHEVRSPAGWQTLLAQRDAGALWSLNRLFELARIDLGISSPMLDMAAGPAAYTDPRVADLVPYFSGLAAVEITYPGADGRTLTAHLWFESSSSGPRLAGLIMETRDLG